MLGIPRYSGKAGRVTKEEEEEEAGEEEEEHRQLRNVINLFKAILHLS